MSGADPLDKRAQSEQAGLIAAYREGLGLAVIAVISGPAVIRIAAAECCELAAAETLQARWWCRRAADAERVAASAMARLRLDQRGDTGRKVFPPGTQRDEKFNPLARAGQSIARAAKALGVALFSEAEIFDHAIAAVAQIDGEIKRMQASGALRSVNRSYRQYRIDTSAKGERVLRYQDWIRKYREHLVRDVASSMKHL